MSRAKQKRKARLAARKQVASARLLASIASGYERAIEQRLAQDPPDVRIEAARAYDAGTVTTWLLTEHPYKGIYQRIQRGWLATTRSSKNPRKARRVARRDMRRLNRAEARADALKTRREWAEMRANKRSWWRLDERMGFAKGRPSYSEAAAVSQMFLGLGALIATYKAMCRPSHTEELAAIASRFRGAQQAGI